MDWMKQSNLDGAELCISNYENIDPYKIKEELDIRGLGCSTLSTGQARGLEGLSLIGVLPDKVRETQKRFLQHIDTAAILGSKVTIGLMRGLGTEVTKSQDLHNLSAVSYTHLDVYKRQWLGFIINQIIFNSIKYCSDKPPVIQIKSKDMGDYVTLSITDNGIGIKPSEVNRVFDKGFVGSNGRMRKKSTGIGLYLCDQLCLKLGIGIDIESEVGCYTTVLLHFPKSNHLNV